MNKLYFIAELGQNHQGSLEIAKRMVDSLVGSGVKAIKTAKRNIDVCLNEDQKSMPYLNKKSFGKTYYEHRKALELSHDDFAELKSYIEDKGFDFIPSFTDHYSLDYLIEIGCKKIKIASQRVIDIDLLNYTAKRFSDTIYMSSGMSDIKDIEEMIVIFKNNEKYLMQCTSVYPAIDKILHLRVLKNYRKRFKKQVNGFGFSSHNRSIAPDVAAYALGANIIERHFTLDRSWKGSDHQVSLEIHHIKKLIKYLNEVAVSLGNSEKKILDEEKPAIKRLRGGL